MGWSQILEQKYKVYMSTAKAQASDWREWRGDLEKDNICSQHLGRGKEYSMITGYRACSALSI